jgi:Na+/proline symporter
MIKKIIYVGLISLMSCASQKNTVMSKQEIEKDFQKAYKENKNRAPHKKELTAVTLTSVLIFAIVIHFTDPE